MKTLTSIILGFLFFFSAVSGYSQTVDTVRQANKIKFFITGGVEPFDQWSTGTLSWGPLGTTTSRFTNLKAQDDTLHFNGEWRGDLWDIDSVENPLYYSPAQPPAPRGFVIGGASASDLDVIIVISHLMKTSLQNARILRFETERHSQVGTLADELTQYCGFFSHSAGIDSLTGRNVYDNNATFPRFLVGSSRVSDTLANAVELKVGTDAPGIFCDTFWNTKFLKDNEVQNLWFWHYGKPLIARFRVRVDSTVDTSGGNHPPLFSFKIKQGTSALTVLDTTVKLDEWIKHANSGYDTISLRFRSRFDSTANKNDTADTPTLFSLSWPDSVSLKMDYMEILTARLDTAQDYHSDELEGDWGERPGTYSYEELSENNDAKLKNLVHILKDSFMGKIQYVMVREEFPYCNDLSFKRATKLLRDSTGGQMELTTSIHDSADFGFYGSGLPNQFVNITEGAKRGWVDTSLYADPKLFMIGQIPWKYGVPLPRRDISTGSTYNTWEIAHVPFYVDCSSDPTKSIKAYSRDIYDV